ncbi:MAG: type III pantothenate kinase [Flavobacteriales bacterium]|nr:type III pantothenate kinase [Flavobacteriales bacterium]MCB9193389.1 type III pantothenate kinase [Flavobacteriales bacterium]
MEEGRIDLVVDVGNSRIKAAVFRGHRVLGTMTADRQQMFDADVLLQGRHPAGIVLASVGGPTVPLVERLRSWGVVRTITGSSPAPIPVAYRSTASLGVDRLANAVAAAALFPGRPMLAIDIGTCITYDLVLPDQGFVGGAIAPGPTMRARSMHQDSATLPEVDPDPEVPAIGRDTRECLAAGVFHGIVHELRGMIEERRQHAPDLGVVLTGGAAPPFVNALKSGIFADPLLTLRGLHALHLHNPVP